MNPVEGPLMFARYAYPPNALGYCGPGDHAGLLQYVETGAADAGLTALARQFHGAWPYLALIAAASRRDPLDPQVVTAYWLGNRLLGRVPPALFAAHLTERFAGQAGPHWSDPPTLAMLGGTPHHNFHVFAVYPWTGLLRAGAPAEPLHVLDRCRIASATVLDTGDGTATVRMAPLRYDAGRLRLGTPEPRVLRAAAGLSVRPGDAVTVHWDWVCEVVPTARAAGLDRLTRAQLRLVNHALGRPAAGSALEPAAARVL